MLGIAQGVSVLFTSLSMNLDKRSGECVGDVADDRRIHVE
jgi:hypothetical protein